ncbi:hypothetical protein ABT294_02085 [Nonomuraea sp. NPDC000554]|uniref:hypothetical protein n=1 Tax=Nonomuraea sp. NPDC000554 TaxID=3154259 RepID=UPI00331C8E52
MLRVDRVKTVSDKPRVDVMDRGKHTIGPDLKSPAPRLPGAPAPGLSLATQLTDLSPWCLSEGAETAAGGVLA